MQGTLHNDAPAGSVRSASRRALKGLGSRAGVGEEELLTVYLEAGDGVLTFAADQPVDEGLSQVGLHARVLLRIDENDAVLIEEIGIALDEQPEATFVSEAQPRSAVGQCISPFAGGDADTDGRTT